MNIYRLIILIIILALPFNSYAYDLDNILYYSMISAHIADWSTTLSIAKNHNKYYEKSFPLGSAEIIGKKPSQSSVNIYFSITLFMKVLVYHFLNDKYKKYWAGFWTLTNGYCAIHNYNIGLRFSF